MDKKLYVVWKIGSWETGEVVSIFDDEELAKQEVKRLYSIHGLGYEIQYDEYILNKPA